MKPVKQVLRPERLRQVPAQFSWVDQALVQRHLIDRCDHRAAALYLFLVTVCDAQGLSYYAPATLAQRLHLSPEALEAAWRQLIDLDLLAYRAPLFQVLALPQPHAAVSPPLTRPSGNPPSRPPAPSAPRVAPAIPTRPRARPQASAAPAPSPTPPAPDNAVSLASLLQALEDRRRGGL